MANSNEEERIPFSDPMFNRNNEIIQSHEPDNYNFDCHNDNSTEEEDSKNIIKPIVSIIAVGVIGYFGFNYLQQDAKKDIVQPNITKDITDTQIVKEDINTNNEKKELQITPTSKIEKVEEKVVKKEKAEKEKSEEKIVEVKKEKVEKKVEKVKEKVTAIEKIEPKVVTTPTPIQVTKNISKIENIDEMKAKVIKTLVQKSKHEKTIKKVDKPKKPQYRIVTVRKGDTLASISKRFYGNPMEFKRIVRANRNIKRASSHLHIGQKIIVPIIKSEETKSKIAKKKIVKPKVVKKKVAKKKIIIRVKKGDTLESISKRFYGSSLKYQKIINANHKIRNKHTRLHIGQKIYIPR